MSPATDIRFLLTAEVVERNAGRCCLEPVGDRKLDGFVQGFRQIHPAEGNLQRSPKLSIT